MQCCRIQEQCGQTLRVTARLRTKEVDGWAGMWVRIDGYSKFELFFDNMDDRPIKGTTNWEIYTIEVQVPDASAWLNFGVVLQGQGAVYIDNFAIHAKNGADWCQLH